jgi:hypothetical protein
MATIVETGDYNIKQQLKYLHKTTSDRLALLIAMNNSNPKVETQPPYPSRVQGAISQMDNDPPNSAELTPTPIELKHEKEMAQLRKQMTNLERRNTSMMAGQFGGKIDKNIQDPQNRGGGAPNQRSKTTNDYVLKQFHAYYNGRKVTNCYLTEENEAKTIIPACDPREGDRLITHSSITPENKKTLVFFMLHSRGCLTCISLLEIYGTDHTLLPHLSITKDNNPFTPTPASMMCPNLMRINQPTKRLEFVKKVGKLCTACLRRLNPRGECNVCKLGKSKPCHTCKVHFLLGDCGLCAERTKRQQEGYNNSFKNSYPERDADISISSQEARLISTTMLTNHPTPGPQAVDTKLAT